jgi:hypothetical protein
MSAARCAEVQNGSVKFPLASSISAGIIGVIYLVEPRMAKLPVYHAAEPLDVLMTICVFVQG